MPDQTGPSRPGRLRHLAAIPPSIPAPRSDPDNRPVPYTLTPRAESALGPPRVMLTLWQRMEAEDARQLVYQLAEASAADLTPALLAFILGRLHGAAMNLLDIIDAITEP